MRKIHNFALHTAYPASCYLCWYEYGSIVADLLLNRMINFNSFVVFNSGLPSIKALFYQYLWHLDMMKLLITRSQFFHAFISTYRLFFQRVLSLSRVLKDVQSVFLQSSLTHRAIYFPIWLQRKLSYQECSTDINIFCSSCNKTYIISHQKRHPVVSANHFQGALINGLVILRAI